VGASTSVLETAHRHALWTVSLQVGGRSVAASAWACLAQKRCSWGCSAPLVPPIVMELFQASSAGDPVSAENAGVCVARVCVAAYGLAAENIGWEQQRT
jgi:hypothetical protein